MFLVVGLGNPGRQYQGNRHNVGFRVVEQLAARAGVSSPREKYGAELYETVLGGERVILCKPMEFMNVSGQAVRQVAGFHKIPAARTIVVHDELDVPFGRLKLAAGGGAGGHNGVRSIIADLGTPDFARVRVGVDRPPPSWQGADYVLANFTGAEQKQLPELIDLAADAVEEIIARGLPAAMNKFNQRPKAPRQPGGDA
ncbi:MAG TPA: aminoacyl-tRNA hydrolase [Polyangia bacterium]|nr:aminoacyl-tRNA hydrolase [Polyangia bacterium]